MNSAAPDDVLDVPTLTCPKCGHVDAFLGDASAVILKCDKCSARIAHGVAMPRIVVNVERPHFVTIAFDNGEPIRLDAEWAALLAANIMAVCERK